MTKNISNIIYFYLRTSTYIHTYFLPVFFPLYLFVIYVRVGYQYLVVLKSTDINDVVSVNPLV